MVTRVKTRHKIQSIGFEAKNISDRDYNSFRCWIYELAGISLSEHKKALVMGRLAPRMRHHNLEDYGDYFKLLTNGQQPSELQIALDLLTTNETFFFREPKHFDFLRKEILPLHPRDRPFRLWSAASSSGEEPYSIAMTLADELGEVPWKILASDVSSRVLEKARTGHYPLNRVENLPRQYLQKYCLKGVGVQKGTFLVDAKLRSRVTFKAINLNHRLDLSGEFDVIFLRNVMIYFDTQTKRNVVSRILPHLRKGGFLLIGHSENLNGVNDQLETIRPSIYRKPN